MNKIRLYKKFDQVIDYVLPAIVLMIAFRPALPLAGKILLITVVAVFLILTIKIYRVSIDNKNIYLDNLFIHKTISIDDVIAIEPAPFYYGATSGRISEVGYRVVYKKGEQLKKAIVLVNRKKEIQNLWEGLKKKVERKTY